jgi:subtilase family serine protease
VVTSIDSGSVTVSNQGAGPAAAFKTEIVDVQTTEAVVLDFPALAAGTSTSVQWNCNDLGRVVDVTADSESTVTESNEENNTLSDQLITGCG